MTQVLLDTLYSMLREEPQMDINLYTIYHQRCIIMTANGKDLNFHTLPYKHIFLPYGKEPWPPRSP